MPCQAMINPRYSTVRDTSTRPGLSSGRFYWPRCMGSSVLILYCSAVRRSSSSQRHDALQRQLSCHCVLLLSTRLARLALFPTPPCMHNPLDPHEIQYRQTHCLKQKALIRQLVHYPSQDRIHVSVLRLSNRGRHPNQRNPQEDTGHRAPAVSNVRLLQGRY